MKASSLSKRALVRIISFSIAFVAAAIAAFTLLSVELDSYKTQVAYSYELALDDLISSLDTIDSALKKGMYCNSAEQWNDISAVLLRAAGTAKSALATLPFSGGELTTVNKFLSQVGDYTTSLSKSALSGASLALKDSENLRLLSDTAGTLYSAVSEIRTGGADFSDEVIASAESGVNSFSAALLETEESLTDYPSLIYDGPFSDHLLNSAPKLLEGKNEITREGARQVAALYLGESTQNIADSGEEESAMPSYCFTVGDTEISITRAGGYCSYFRKYRDIGESKRTYDEAIKTAADFLGRLDLGNFRDSYYMCSNGLCVINFAYETDGVICYPDLVKVGVAMDTGEILLFEGRGFIMNHRQRSLPRLNTTAEQAQQKLNPVLTVKSSSLAIIPTDGGEEKLCYEFNCESGDDSVMVYINAENLSEEEILILLMVDGGILTR